MIILGNYVEDRILANDVEENKERGLISQKEQRTYVSSPFVRFSP
jgi:hypothetical protein